MKKKLTYGTEGYKEIEEFLNESAHKDYSLSIFDTLSNCTMEIICPFEEMLSAIVFISSTEHDFPEWIGANDLSESYVVGMKFTRGVFHTPGYYKCENGKLIDMQRES